MTSWPIESTGIKQHVDGSFSRIPPFDERTGAHFWVVGLAYRVVDPERGATADDPIHLDTENLVMASAVGCYYCEVVYTPRMATRRCPGRARRG